MTEEDIKCSRYFVEEEDFSFHILDGSIVNGQWEGLEEELGNISSMFSLDNY